MDEKEYWERYAKKQRMIRSDRDRRMEQCGSKDDTDTLNFKDSKSANKKRRVH